MTSSGAAAKRTAKSAVEGVAMDPMECRVPAGSYCVLEGCMLAVTHLLNRRRMKATQHSEVDSDEFAGKIVID